MLALESVAGDGSCLYHSIRVAAKHMLGWDMPSVQDLRVEVAAEIRANGALYPWRRSGKYCRSLRGSPARPLWGRTTGRHATRPRLVEEPFERPLCAHEWESLSSIQRQGSHSLTLSSESQL